ncbi:THUMP-like domain-containing protein [Bifidobacterium goeldii]|nr:SAM-dependent methyltransferase [Bifidobacterium goeldii]
MLITPQTARFIAEHRLDNVRDLALKAKREDGLDLPFALDQIAGWQTARTKLPQWAEQSGIIYPPHLSMEQCSSQFTAQYKADLARRLTSAANGAANSAANSAAGKAANGCLVDLTGGFGVDCSYMAREFAQTVYIERQEHLCVLAEHNMQALGLRHVRIVCGDAVTMLADDQITRIAPSQPALIFIDPARRDEHGGRTYAIEDCTPDVLALKDRLLELAPHVMIKLSPMLDWRKTVADFRGAVSEVHIVSTGNECKELLLVLERRHSRRTSDNDAPVRVYCVNDNDIVDFAYDPANTSSDRALGFAPLPQPIRYLYEPNASLMKAGCFALLEERYGITQIGPNSHLLVSAADQPISGFPGRAFAVEAMGGMGKKEVKTLLQGAAKANIAVRNFPLTVAQLRKKLKLGDGGDVYLFATTLAGNKHVLIRCTRCAA